MTFTVAMVKLADRSLESREPCADVGVDDDVKPGLPKPRRAQVKVKATVKSSSRGA